MMKTAVQYLVKEFSDILGKLETTHMQNLLLFDAIKKVKSMEKDQIANAYDRKQHDGVKRRGRFKNGNEYYAENFKEEVF